MPMSTIHYETNSGYKRHVSSVTFSHVSANKRYSVYISDKGKTYQIWAHDNHVSVSTPTNWCRVLGYHAYIQTNNGTKL